MEKAFEFIKGILVRVGLEQNTANQWEQLIKLIVIILIVGLDIITGNYTKDSVEIFDVNGNKFEKEIFNVENPPQLCPIT